MNRIPSLGGAHAEPTTILVAGTPLGTQPLLIGIVDEIARIADAARVSLEGMHEAQPVPDLVHRRPA